MSRTRLLFAPGDLRGADSVDDAALVGAIGEVESAWVTAQAAAGLVSAETRTAVTGAVDAVTWDLQADAEALAGLAADAESGGNPVIPFLTRVRARLTPEAGRALHRGLTSQDVMDSALGLLVTRTIAETRARLDVITEALRSLSEAHADTLCLARTLTQPALPTTFGLRVATWAAEVAEVAALTPRSDAVQVGGAAGTRAAIREFAGDRTEALLREFEVQLRGPDAALSPTPVPWHTDRVRVLTWATHFTQCVGVGSSIARNVLIGTRPEVGELALAATGGSSAMPQKTNPTVAVLLHRNGMRAPGLLATVATTGAAAVEERSDGAWHAEWPALSALMVLALSSLALLEEMATGLSARPEAMRRNLDAAGPGIYGEKLTIVFGDRLSKDAITEILSGSGDPAERLGAALSATPGPVPDPAELEGFFAPSSYLGEAEGIRETIIRTTDPTTP
ncbi:MULTISPECIES: lyase family protein [Brevibacterium]|uniref:lyase family protein n=1 Tax=Brevibacterium TaxID=1696 RepID=UPI0031D6AF73